MTHKRKGLHGPVSWASTKNGAKTGTAQGTDERNPDNTLVLCGDSRIRSKRTDLLDRLEGSYLWHGDDDMGEVSERMRRDEILRRVEARQADAMRELVSARADAAGMLRDHRASGCVLGETDLAWLARAQVAGRFWTMLGRQGDGLHGWAWMRMNLPPTRGAAREAHLYVDGPPHSDPLVHGLRMEAAKAGLEFLDATAAAYAMVLKLAKDASEKRG
jgi:hypothetical protein